eukprot:5095725-Amphidinium_carterae.1
MSVSFSSLRASSFDLTVMSVFSDKEDEGHCNNCRRSRCGRGKLPTRMLPAPFHQPAKSTRMIRRTVTT